MREVLQLHMEEQQYREMIRRYHFNEEDLAQIRQIGKLTMEAAAPVLYYEILEQDSRLAVIVTLGEGVDELQQRCVCRERLLESYMIECVAMELMRCAYEQAAECIHAHTGMWITGFDFLGDKIPLNCMEEIFVQLMPLEVSYNQAYMLTPRKSVVFMTGLCAKRQDSYCRVCSGCGNLSCTHRQPG